MNDAASPKPDSSAAETSRTRVSQADIAQAVGVSVSTVSRVLSGAAGISERVRGEVLRAARELGHRGMTGLQHTGVELKSAFLLFNENSHQPQISSIYGLILEGLRAAAEDSGIALHFLLRNNDEEIPEAVFTRSDAGVLFVGIDPTPDALARLSNSGVPTVLVNGLDPDLRVHAVSPANYFGGRLVARFLVERGHRRILHLSSRQRWTLRRRTEGFLQGVEDYSNGNAIVDTRYFERLEASYIADALTDAFREDVVPPSAIFCSNDLQALATVQTLQARGISVPGDVSVMGFDDLPIADLCDPGLSTIRVDWLGMGQEAFRLLNLGLVSDKYPARQVQTGVALVARASVSQAPPF
ncbi:LacI family DNA-binding transcriptional regulator [Granulosicoccus sp. 3-233]|uniref:LacI family DNA-binding transcriptional regulator n=1 Tax=Granulosicoccus sp. 3-233 TaxID=3417969 RepID=UPI003D351440